MQNIIPHLSPRLSLIASKVASGTVVADIGTDHAFLPIYLAACNKCEKVYATDLKKEPADRARRNIKRFCQDNKVTVLTGYGTEPVEGSDTDTIIIAGMGGELIMQILSSSKLAAGNDVTLILQPQSYDEKVRKWLSNNGFYIDDEEICEDSKRIYLVIVAKKGKQEDNSLTWQYLGDKLSCRGGDLYKKYLDKRLNVMKKAKYGLSKAKTIDDDRMRLLCLLIEEIEKRIDEGYKE